MEIHLCWLATVLLIILISDVESGKKKDKGLIIVLSNGGCGGNILVQTASKDGKKGGGHKIVVKGGDSGGGCGCSNSCGSCGGGGHSGHEHTTVQHVPIPIPVPAGAPLPPPHEMHAAMMSQLRPVFSSADDSSSSSSSDSSPDQEPQASDSSSSTSDDSGKSSSSSSSSDKTDMASPLFIPMNAITPPWLHGSPVFMDPSTMKTSPKGYHSSSSSSSPSESNYHEKGEYTSSSDIAPTFNDPMFNLHGTNGQLLPPPMGFQGFDPNNGHLMSHPSTDGNKKDSQQLTENNKSTGRGRNGYLQPLIDSVQRLLRGPGPLHAIEQNLVKQGQRMQAYASNLVPISISNVTSYLPSLPGLRSSSGNRDRKPAAGETPATTTGGRGSRYLDSLRIRLRPLALMEGNRLTSTIENLWKNIRGRTSSSSSSSSSSSHQPISQESNINQSPEITGNGNSGHLNQIHHHQHQPLSPLPPPNGHHPVGHPAHHHFNIPGQQNNQVMQQYLEQILTSKWWEWPSGGLLGPNLNQY